jgi:hypothetical protein
MASATSQVSALISRYSPAVARQFRVARASLRRHFPRGYELVFENYNALGCGYSRTDRGSGVVVSVVAYPRWVTLFFFDGMLEFEVFVLSLLRFFVPHWCMTLFSRRRNAGRTILRELRSWLQS